jgi:hypothetical protein
MKESHLHQFKSFRFRSIEFCVFDSKTTVFFVLVEFNDEDKKDLPHTDVEEIQSTAWVKLSDALLIPSYKFFIPENSTYLVDVSRLLYDYQNMGYDQFNELYNGKDLEIENDD